MKFEFQTILTTSYEVINFLRTRDLVDFLQLKFTDPSAMPTVESPQVFLFSPGRKGLEDWYESPEMTSENANEQVQANYNSNDMMLLQRITLTMLEKISDEVRTAIPETMMEMFAHVRHKS